MKTLARAQDTAELLRRLRTLRPDSTRRWGRMTASQMICHLSDGFKMAAGQKAVNDVSRPLQRTLVKWVALYLPMRWPPGLSTIPEIDQHHAGTAPTEFAADLAELAAFIEQFAAPRPGVERPAHPIFGRLSPTAWLRWAYLHVDHHLRQFGA